MGLVTLILNIYGLVGLILTVQALIADTQTDILFIIYSIDTYLEGLTPVIEFDLQVKKTNMFRNHIEIFVLLIQLGFVILIYL